MVTNPRVGLKVINDAVCMCIQQAEVFCQGALLCILLGECHVVVVVWPLRANSQPVKAIMCAMSSFPRELQDGPDQSWPTGVIARHLLTAVQKHGIQRVSHAPNTHPWNSCSSPSSIYLPLASSSLPSSLFYYLFPIPSDPSLWHLASFPVPSASSPCHPISTSPPPHAILPSFIPLHIARLFCADCNVRFSRGFCSPKPHCHMQCCDVRTLVCKLLALLISL